MNKNFVVLGPGSTITKYFDRGLVLNGRAYLKGVIYFYEEVMVNEGDVHIEYTDTNIPGHKAIQISLHKDRVKQYATSYERTDYSRVVKAHIRKRKKKNKQPKRKTSSRPKDNVVEDMQKDYQLKEKQLNSKRKLVAIVAAVSITAAFIIGIITKKLFPEAYSIVNLLTTFGLFALGAWVSRQWRNEE